jgi:molybdate transport system regulatory protein
MKIIYKVWLQKDNGRAFGEGPHQLLKGVEMTGSLKEAAARIGMAYSQARLLMEGCESHLGFALILRKQGGVSGGGSEITPEAVELMKAYKSLRADIGTVLAEVYERHFGQSIQVRFDATVPKRRRAKHTRKLP